MSETTIGPEGSETVTRSGNTGALSRGLVHLGPRSGGQNTAIAVPTVSHERRTAILEQGYRRRKATNAIVLGFAAVCAVIAIVPLFAVAVYVAVQGVSSLNISFFTHAQYQVNQDYTNLVTLGVPQGLGNTILGSLILVLVASLMGLPIGLFSGIYLSEYGHNSRFARTVRFLADVVAGIPSIVAGLVGYALIAATFGFSAFAGGFALALLMFPVVTRSTEEVLRLVPNSLREGGLALGLPRWRIIASIVLPAASSGIITSMLLGVARVTGETAPLFFTSFANSYWETNPLHSVGALPYTIFSYSFQYGDKTGGGAYHRMAFAGALVLVAIVVLLNLAARVFFRQRVRGRT